MCGHGVHEDLTSLLDIQTSRKGVGDEDGKQWWHSSLTQTAVQHCHSKAHTACWQLRPCWCCCWWLLCTLGELEGLRVVIMVWRRVMVRGVHDALWKGVWIDSDKARDGVVLAFYWPTETCCKGRCGGEDFRGKDKDTCQWKRVAVPASGDKWRLYDPQEENGKSIQSTEH